jgi:colanic acid biosynthesis glycosyl transferase WcaI
MKILIYSINTLPEPISTGKYTGEMATWLAGQGHDVRMVSAPPFYPYWKIQPPHKQWAYERELLDNVTIFRCPLWVPRHPSGFKRIVHLLSFALSSFPIVVWQRAWKPDLIMVIEPTILCAPAGLLLAWLSKARSWLHIQDFETDAAFALDLLAGKWFRKLISLTEKFLLHRFDTVSTISRKMLERLASKDLPAHKSLLFPNWVDTDRIHPLEEKNIFRQQLGLDDHCVVCLYSGNMGNKQGLAILADVARILACRNDIMFVFCGEGSGKKDLQHTCATLENVRFLELQPINRLNELLNLADIHLLPQREDAADLVMPSKLTGMLASGRPIVATAPKGTELADIVSGCGEVVPPSDVHRMSQALLHLADSSALRSRYGRAAREYAVTRLSKKKTLHEFEKSVRHVCG